MISFAYEPWDLANDVPLNRPGNVIAFGAIKHGYEIGHRVSKKAERTDALIGLVENGVIELIAGGLEYLRRRGLPAAEVEQRVRGYLHTAHGTRKHNILKDARIDTHVLAISDPRNIKHRIGELGQVWVR